jgi:hypothetical protein
VLPVQNPRHRRAPIDFHADNAAIAVNTQLVTDTFGLAPYRAIVAASGGNMPGSAVLSGFIAIQPEAEVAKQLQLFNNLDNDDYVQRYNEFEDWFKHRPHPRGVCARRQ